MGPRRLRWRVCPDRPSRPHHELIRNMSYDSLPGSPTHNEPISGPVDSIAKESNAASCSDDSLDVPFEPVAPQAAESGVAESNSADGRADDNSVCSTAQGGSPEQTSVDCGSEPPASGASSHGASAVVCVDSTAESGESARAAATVSAGPSARRRMGVGRAVYLMARCVLLATLAGILLGAAWLKLTPEGQATWHDIAPAFLPAIFTQGGATSSERELAIGAGLQKAGAVVVWGPLGDQKRISSVDFQHCHPNAEMLQQLVELQHLSSVSLARCPLDTAELAQIGRLDQIVSLSLGGTAINDEGLKHLSRMQRLTALFLPDTPVSDAGLAELTGLRDLRILDLSRTQITDAGMAIIARCPRLEHLLISETAVTDAGLDKLHGAKKLRRVTLLGTKTTRAGHERLRAAFTEIMMTIDF